MDFNEAQLCLYEVENSIREFGYNEERMADSIFDICMCTALIGKVTYNRYMLINEMLGLEIDYFNFGFLIGRYGNFKGEYVREKLQGYLKPFESSPKILLDIYQLMLAIASADGDIPNDVMHEILVVTVGAISSTETDASNGNRDIHIGDVVEIGYYYQESNQKEKLKWIVINERDGKKMLITKDVIDAKAYNSSGKATDWLNSSIRRWLNCEFFSNVFSPEEAKKVIEDENGDKVFLLDGNIICSIMAKEERVCIATDYAKSQGATTGVFKPCSCYWLRSDDYNTFAPMVFGGGSITGDPMSDGITLRGGKYVGNIEGIRPSIWIC